MNKKKYFIRFDPFVYFRQESKSSRQKHFIMLSFMVAPLLVFSQKSVTGKVFDLVNNKLLVSATVLPGYNKVGTVTDSNGRFSITLTDSIKALFISYSGYQSSIVSVDENTTDLLVGLQPIENKLEQVTITARKPLYEQKIDRLVINVTSNITAAGGSVLDVLERSPGIVVDRQNNVLSINGKNGIVVMINGKLNHMPVATLVQMLAGMPSDNVEKVELIKTPPSNFDAEGNAGFINIVLKKNMQYGTNGSYSVTQGYSKGLVTTTTGNFNHRATRWNLYSNYSLNRIASAQTGIFFHATQNQGTYFEDFSKSERDPVETISDLKLGFDYEIKNDLVAGVLFSLYNRSWNMHADNFSSIYSNRQLDTSINVANKEKHPLNSDDVNLNLQRNYKQGKLTFNIDYMNYRETNPVGYLNSYHNATGVFLYDEEMKSNKNTPVHLWVGTIDMDRTITSKLSMSVGLKSSFSSFSNTVEVDRLLQSGWIADPAYTAAYFLNENISAVYSDFDWSLSEKTKIKAGLRFEYTNSNLGTATEKNIVDRHYGKLFPSLFLSNSLKDNNSLSFAYSRRITRPTFWNLAPFVLFQDPNTFFSGNPGLQPTITDNVNTSFTFRKNIFSISYSNEANPITNFSPHVDGQSNKETLSAENQDNSKLFNINMSFPFDLAKWCTMQINLNGQYIQMNDLYNNELVELKQGSFFANATQNFKLPKEFTLSLSGYYNSGTLSGLYKIKPLGSLDLGLQKKLKGNKSNLRLNYANVLNSIKYVLVGNVPEKNLVAISEFRLVHPALRLTFTHNFGSDKVKGKRDRLTGAEEEKNRLRM